MSSAVSWDVARRVATWVADGRGGIGSPPPTLSEGDRRRLEDDFAAATSEAETLVVEATGLQPLSGNARGQVVDRAGWVDANVESFQQLLQPLLDQLPGSALPGPMAKVSPQVAGVQMGAVLGWMAGRVLGQYDLLLTERGGSERSGQGDVVHYVGPNIVALERRHGFPPEHFRLWIALHEVTHRCQFTAVAWLRPYFLSLVDQAMQVAKPDPKQLLAALRRAAEAARHGSNPLDEAGVLGLVAPPEQLAVLRQVQALMSVLEGHGDITMNRAGAGAVPEAQWFARVLNERRKRANPMTRLILQLTGLDAKLKQYAQGERFVEAVEASGGPALFRRVWEGPDMLPTLQEIREPAAWLARVQPPGIAAG